MKTLKEFLNGYKGFDFNNGSIIMYHEGNQYISGCDWCQLYDGITTYLNNHDNLKVSSWKQTKSTLLITLVD